MTFDRHGQTVEATRRATRERGAISTRNGSVSRSGVGSGYKPPNPPESKKNIDPEKLVGKISLYRRIAGI